MKKTLFFIMAVMIIFSLSSAAIAANTATQNVDFGVSEINELAVSGDPGTLTINAATAGSEPTAATDDTTDYSLTTNDAVGSNKITAGIDSPMPTAVTLSVNLTAPAGGATSSGSTLLSTTAADVVTGIGTVAESNIGIEYTLAATVAAVVATGSRTVTLTLMDQ